MKRAKTAEERLAQARVHYGRCNLCEWRCGADRQFGVPGPCKAGAQARVYCHRVEYSDEAELVPGHLFWGNAWAKIPPSW